MKRWLPLFSTILAVGLAVVEARAQIPGFVRPGLALTYSGTAKIDNIPGCGDPEPSSQTINVTTANTNVVNGTTMITINGNPKYPNCGAPGQQVQTSWTCPLNQAQACVMDPSALGGIAQFWVNPARAENSIHGPNNEQYTPETCPAEVATAGISNVACLHFVKCKQGVPVSNCVDRVRGQNVTEELLLAYDTTGLVRYSVQYFAPKATAEGPGQGEFIYTLQSILQPLGQSLPWQSDGTSIFLQDTTGDIVISQLKGTNVTGGGILTTPGRNWHVEGFGDFNGDGKLDILWQSDSGDVVIWLTNETSYITGGLVGKIDPSWHIKGTGDFNKDGKSDILLQSDYGDVVIWEIDGTRYIGGGYVGNAGNFHAVGTGDFNMDGKSDILFQNDNGDVVIWEIDGTRYIGGGYVGNAGNFHALGTGDFYGNGLSDILFQNDKGDVVIWEINGTRYVDGGYVGNAGNFHAVGTGDFDMDGKSDILFQNDNGDVVIWEMNGIKYIGGGSINK